jgi:hypothetical protein
MTLLTLLVAAQAVVTPAPAQAVPAAIAPSTPVAAIIAPSSEPVLRAGADVPLVMSETITTNGKKLRVGQRVRLKVASDVRHGTAVVIPAGSPAEAEITDVRNKGMWGKSGRIEARLLNVRVGDRLIRLSGTFDDKGVTGTAGVVAAIALIPVAGFFMTGTSATIQAGSGIKAFLDEDLRIAAPVAPAQPVSAPVVAPSAS